MRDWASPTTWLSFVIVTGWLTVIAYVLKFGITSGADSRDILMSLIGSLTTTVAGVTGYHYGTSRGEQAAKETIATTLDKVTAEVK